MKLIEFLKDQKIRSVGSFFLNENFGDMSFYSGLIEKGDHLWAIWGTGDEDKTLKGFFVIQDINLKGNYKKKLEQIDNTLTEKDIVGNVSIMVGEEFKNQGIGKSACNEIVEKIKQVGIHKMLIWLTNPNNKVSEKTAGACGFIDTKKIIDGEHAFNMVLKN